MTITKTIKLPLEVKTDAEYNSSLKAAQKIIKSIPHEDLIYLADLAEKKPNFVKSAKPYVHML